jgi:hypothetical protein
LGLLTYMKTVPNVILAKASVLLDLNFHMLRNAGRRKIRFSGFLMYGQRRNLIRTWVASSFFAPISEGSDVVQGGGFIVSSNVGN